MKDTITVTLARPGGRELTYEFHSGKEYWAELQEGLATLPETHGANTTLAAQIHDLLVEWGTPQ